MCSRRRKILSKAMESDWAACLHLYTLNSKPKNLKATHIPKPSTAKQNQDFEATLSIPNCCSMLNHRGSKVADPTSSCIILLQACSKHAQAFDSFDKLAEVRCTR